MATARLQSTPEAVLKDLAIYVPQRAAETAEGNPIATLETYESGWVSFVPVMGAGGVPLEYRVTEGLSDATNLYSGRKRWLGPTDFFEGKKFWDVTIIRPRNDGSDVRLSLRFLFRPGNGGKTMRNREVDEYPLKKALLKPKEHSAIEHVFRDSILLRGMARCFEDADQLAQGFAAYLEQHKSPEEAEHIWSAYLDLRYPERLTPEVQAVLGGKTLMLALFDDPPELPQWRGPAFGPPL